MADDRIGIRLEPRDFAFLIDLFESRVLSTGHATALHFGGSRDAAKKRIRSLKTAGYIAERPRKTFDEAVYFLTRRAIQALQEAGRLADYPKLSLSVLDKRAKVSNLTIAHELAVADVKGAFFKAVAERPALTMTRFSTWPRLFSFVSPTWLDGFRMRPRPVKPDGFMLVHEQVDGPAKPHAFFVEVDMTNENFNKMAVKAVAYLHYYSSGGFALWRGGSRDNYKQHPFRILGIFKKEKRKRHFAERLLQNNPPIKHQWYLADLADVIRDPFGAIWTTPADYAAGQPNSTAEPTPHQLFVSSKEIAERPNDRSET